MYTDEGTNSATFGTQLKMALLLKGITQRQLAQSCKMDTGNVNRVLNGKSMPSYGTMKRMMDAAGMEMKLISKTDPDEENDYTGNNGPLRSIKAEDVLVDLNELATSGILAEKWRDVIMDAFKLIWMRYE